ncbi:hypothetical protein OK006_11001 [Actinobacteria bacterium OK006]|nr:hypothetical protein OK006_11001 [Actinobacteria bacterium OK006]
MFGLSGRPSFARRQWSRAAALVASLTLGVVGLSAQEAYAQGPCGTNGTFSGSTCTYTTTGEDTFTVPAGVTSIHVVADGAAGGFGATVSPGGAGARVTADLTVTPGSTWYVDIGVGGGAGGSANGGAGGGESDFRNCSASSCALTGVPSSDPRLLVGAGGGGGGGGTHDPRPGGAGGVGPAYCNPGSDGTGVSGAGQGTGGTCTTGGTGGGSSGGGTAGTNGSPGLGGNGGNFGSPSGGGGGGAGFWGGGGGGTGNDTGAGGGGGSSFATTSANNVSTVANPNTTPQVTISFTPVTPVPTLVTTPNRTTARVSTPVIDRATVTGNAQSGNPADSGATVRFFVCGPPASSCNSGGTPVDGPRPLTATSATSATATSGPFTPTVTGTYCFRAEYSGNPSYAPTSADGSGECFTVTPRGSGGWDGPWHPHPGWYYDLSHPHW